MELYRQGRSTDHANLAGKNSNVISLSSLYQKLNTQCQLVVELSCLKYEPYTSQKRDAPRVMPCEYI